MNSQKKKRERLSKVKELIESGQIKLPSVEWDDKMIEQLEAVAADQGQYGYMSEPLPPAKGFGKQ